jgi:hypothetical protein
MHNWGEYQGTDQTPDRMFAVALVFFSYGRSGQSPSASVTTTFPRLRPLST